MDGASWLKGLIDGDGYLDDRHLEIYSSSEPILKKATAVLRKMKVKTARIRVDIYSEKPENRMVQKWANILKLPIENFILRKNTSPWNARTEKIRLRVASKELVLNINKIQISRSDYIRGLFDAEASVDIKGYIEFKQVLSEKGKFLTNKVHKQLKQMKIETTEPKIKNDRNIKKDIYFYVKDLEKYKNKIGFEDLVKEQKLKILIKAKKFKRRPSLSEIQKLKDKSLWEKISILKCPYHVLRTMKIHPTAR